MEIQYDFVLGDRLCCIENQRVYILPEKGFGSSWRTRQTLWGAEQMLTQKHVAKRYMIAKK